MARGRHRPQADNTRRAVGRSGGFRKRSREVPGTKRIPPVHVRAPVPVRLYRHTQLSGSIDLDSLDTGKRGLHLHNAFKGVNGTHINQQPPWILPGITVSNTHTLCVQGRKTLQQRQVSSRLLVTDACTIFTSRSNPGSNIYLGKAHDEVFPVLSFEI